MMKATEHGNVPVWCILKHIDRGIKQIKLMERRDFEERILKECGKYGDTTSLGLNRQRSARPCDDQNYPIV
jgi:hypothetical protein